MQIITALRMYRAALIDINAATDCRFLIGLPLEYLQRIAVLNAANIAGACLKYKVTGEGGWDGTAYSREYCEVVFNCIRQGQIERASTLLSKYGSRVVRGCDRDFSQRCGEWSKESDLSRHIDELGSLIGAVENQ